MKYCPTNNMKRIKILFLNIDIAPPSHVNFEWALLKKKFPMSLLHSEKPSKHTVTRSVLYFGERRSWNSRKEIYIHRNCLNGYRFMVLVSDTFNDLKQKEKHFSRYLMLLKTNFTLGMARRASYYDIREPKSLMLYDYWQRQHQQVGAIFANAATVFAITCRGIKMKYNYSI
jgi:hypothetical protein